MWEILEHKTKKKVAAVDPNHVPSFQEATANPDKAMSQILAMRSSNKPTAEGQVRAYDRPSGGKVMPW